MSYREYSSHSAKRLGLALQTLGVMEFERAVWVAARDSEGTDMMQLLGRGTLFSIQYTSGYTTHNYAARAGHGDIVQVRN